MLTRISGVITGGIAFAAGAYMLYRQFMDPTGAQSFAIGMGIALLIGGAAAAIVSLHRRR
jgi:hypothetical protein